MEPTPYHFTPNQWGALQTLSDETGKPIHTLIDDMLEDRLWREHERREVLKGLKEAENGHLAPFDAEDTIIRGHQRRAGGQAPPSD